MKFLAIMKPAKRFAMSVSKIHPYRSVLAILALVAMLPQVALPLSGGVSRSGSSISAAAFLASQSLLVNPTPSVDASGYYTASNRTMTFFERNGEVTGTYTYSSSKYPFTGTVNGNNLAGTIKINTAANYTFNVTFAGDGQSFTGTDSWGGLTGTKQNTAIIRTLPSQAILQTGASLSLDGMVGGVPDKSIAWIATGGSVDGNGLFTAPSTPGVYVVTATSNAQPAVTATTTIQVTEDGKLDASGYYTAANRTMTFFERNGEVTGTYAYATSKFPFTGTVSGYTLTGSIKINASTSYTLNATFAPDGQSFTGNDAWGSLSATKQPTAVIRLLPTQSMLQVGASMSLDGLVGGVTDKRILWSATGGTIDGNGVYQAPSQCGAYVVTAKSAVQENVMTSTTILVTVDGELDPTGAFAASNRAMTFFERNGEVTGTYAYSTSKFPFTGTVSGYTLTGSIKVNASTSYTLTATFAPDGQSFTGNDAWGNFTATKQSTAVIRLIPAQSLLQTGGSLSLDGLVGGVTDKRILWSATGGAVDGNGVFQAPAQPGAYVVTARSATQESVSASATILVTEDGKVDPTGLYTASNRTLTFYQRNGEVFGSYTYASGKYTFTGSMTGYGLTGKIKVNESTSHNLTATFAPDGLSFAGTDVWGSFTATKQATAVIRLLPTQALLKVGNRFDLDGLVGGVPDKRIAWSTTGGQLSGASFTAATPGVYTVTAASQVQPNVQASSILLATPDGILNAAGNYTATSRAMSFYQDGTQVTGTYKYGSTTYDFTGSVSGYVLTGTFGPNKYAFTGTFAADGLSFTATDPWNSGFIATLAAGAVSVRVLPKPVAVRTGGTQAFWALVNGTTDTRVQWSVLESAGGSIDSEGRYLAPTTAGTYTVKAVSLASPTQSDTSIVTVRPPVVMAPLTATLQPGGTQTFTATLTQFPEGTQPTWRVVEPEGGTIDAKGVYTASQEAGTFTVEASAQDADGITWTATAKVTVPFSLIVTPNAPTIGTLQQKQFYATLSGAANKSILWSVEPPEAGTIDATGLFTAAEYVANPAGTAVLIRATSVARPTQSAVASATLKQTVWVSPATNTVKPGHTAVFTATVTGLASSAVTWSADGGSITQSGAYTAPSTKGVYTITATSLEDPKHKGTAQVTVPITVQIPLSSPVLVPRSVPVQFTAVVQGSTNENVHWSILGDCDGGITNFDDPVPGGWLAYMSSGSPNRSVQNVCVVGGGVPNESRGGIFVARKDGTYTLVAVSDADGSVSASITIQVQGLVAIDPGGEMTMDAETVKNFTARRVYVPSANDVNARWNVGTGAIELSPTFGFINVETTGGELLPLDGHDAPLRFVATYTSSPSGGGSAAMAFLSGFNIHTGIKYKAPVEHGVYYLKAYCEADPTIQGVVKINVPLWVKIEQAAATWVPLGETFKLTAKVSGSRNKAVDWKLLNGLGSIDPDGTYHAPETWPYAPGAYAGWSSYVTVRATLQEDPSKYADIYFFTGPRIWIWTDTSSQVQATSGRLLYLFQDGKQLPFETAQWSPSGGQFSFLPGKLDGYWVAPDQAGTYTITATRKDDATASTSVTFTVPLTVTINEPNAFLKPLAQTRFSAKVLGSANKAVTWSLSNPSCGTITEDGLYTAPEGKATQQNTQIIATSVADPNVKTHVYAFIEALGGHIYGYSSVDVDQVTRYYLYAGNGAATPATWTCSGGSITADGVFTAPSTAGTVTLTAVAVNDSGLTDTLTVTVNPTLTLSATPGTQLGLPLSGPVQLQAVLKGLANPAVTWSFSNTSHVGELDASTGVYTPPAAPPYHGYGFYVRATSVERPSLYRDLVLSLYDPLVVNPPTVIVEPGTSKTFSLSLHGPVAEEVVWTTSGGTVTQTGVFTAPVQAGTYTVTATWAKDPSVTDSALVTVPARVVITPSKTYVPVGTTRTFKATVPGDPTNAVQWTLGPVEGGNPGQIDQTGRFTPSAQAGTYEVVATSAADTTKRAKAEVVVPISLDIAPAQARVKPGGLMQFASKNLTGSTNASVTWSVMPAEGGSISATGLYTAPGAQGSYTVVATSVADPRYMASATVIVAEQDELEIQIDPQDVSLAKGGTATFTARINGQPSTAVTWSVVQAAGGSIDAAGAYTAPAQSGTYTVKATSTEDTESFAIASVVVSDATGTDQTFTYDANGNMTSDGTRTFEWDEENRLVSVTTTATGHRTEYVYDGLGRRVQIIEKEIAADLTETVSSDKKYLWVGTQIAEERSGVDGGIVLKRFYMQGFVDSDGTSLLYTRDNLGSIHELVDMSQTVRARYDYDPYGNVTKVIGDRDSQFLYTGHFWDGRNGLYLTLFRAYDPVLGRWLSRDPKGESAGFNLYGYVKNMPIRYFDPLGLDIWIAGPGKGNMPLHKRICVGNPCGSYRCFSFALNLYPDRSFLSGIPYIDEALGGDIKRRISTTPAQDEAAMNALIDEVATEQIGPYGPIDGAETCRSWSDKWFDHFQDHFANNKPEPIGRPGNLFQRQLPIDPPIFTPVPPMPF